MLCGLGITTRSVVSDVWYTFVHVVTEVWLKDYEKKCDLLHCGAKCGDCSVGWASAQEVW